MKIEIIGKPSFEHLTITEQNLFLKVILEEVNKFYGLDKQKKIERDK
jgi:hypothetical protein